MQKLTSVCFFGSYTQDYSRSNIIRDGLQKNGVSVIECHSSIKSALKRYPTLFKKYWHIKNRVDLIYVAFFGHLDMPLAWFLGKLTGKKVVFDMFYSMYDTYVFDRKSTTPGSLLAKSYAFIDKVAASLADMVITDTQAHANYFIKTFKLNPKKFRRLFVGGDDTIFKSTKKPKTRTITVEFHGYFTRLHGAEFFVEAAKLLENESYIKFLLIGVTSNYFLPIERYHKLKPKNMTYIPELTPIQLSKTIAEADITIGHIGITEKARSVITNKIFHALACKTAVIAGDCSASRELLQDHETALFVQMGDPEDLAKKIKLLAKDTNLRKKLIENGFSLFSDKLTNQKLGLELLRQFQSLMKP